MTNWTFLQVAANFTTIADTLASWGVGSALAIPAYDAIRLRTQVDRLLDEQYILTRVLFPDNYSRLTLADRHRIISALGRYVLIAILCLMVTHSHSIQSGGSHPRVP
jgi:hypothetical protein